MLKFAETSDIAEGQARGYHLDNRRILVIRRDGRLFAYLNRCPHLGVPLEWQENQFLDADGDLIQCATHGALFIVESGECVAGPCLGASLAPIDIEERDGGIYLAPGDQSTTGTAASTRSSSGDTDAR